MQPVDGIGSLSHKGGAIASKLSQVTLLGIRNKAGSKQAMTEQVGYPLGIFDIGLATRDRLDVLGVDHQQFELSLQQVVDRLPKDATVDSIATWVHPSEASQSAIFKMSPVMVPKVRICLCVGLIRQATTLFL